LQFNFVKKGDAFFRPYIFAGVGFRNLSDPGSTQYVPPTCNEGTDLVIPAGLGLEFKIYKNLRLRYIAMFGYTNHDVRDRNNTENGNDYQLDQSIGLTLNIGPKIDTDGDGVADRKDKCPDTPAGALVDELGCIVDRDRDGFADNQDDCPDTDGDGIIDPKDKCPGEAGPVETQGCPDRDKDGILDKDDKCPDVFGITENKGCPEIKLETKQIFERALQGIQFETGKDIIRKSSFGILDEVVTVMNENPEYSLSVYGYTDNTGDDEMNMALSLKRADAVKKYLVNKGVPEGRIKEVKGFGETMPVATNDTPEGRTLNRRVEFKVVF